MNRDPIYGQIVDRLNGTLDPDLFEQCAADLLRDIYPGLTPMPGGTDSGMDGAIGDGLAEPFPLVTTTAKDVIGNLTRNLTTYLQDGGKRRKVVLATSRSLTTKRKDNLYGRARELGFELVNIHAQAAIAGLLYRDPKWCLELLNLPSDPPPLSRIPKTRRPLYDAPLIGRNSSLDWLRQTTDDSVLIGQPASGKTFLLQKIAQEDGGLFLVTGDRGEIAVGIRSQQPTAVFVDDVGADHDLLGSLIQMRSEIGAVFHIIVTGWPGNETALVETMNIPAHRVHRLEPLTRDEIKEVIYHVGVRSPDELVGEIIDQAEGRPGLAVTLALLWLQGGRREVVFGDRLYSTMVDFAEKFVNKEAAPILAIIALSGKAGLSLLTVAELTGSPEIQVHRVLNQLTASGVVMVVDGDRLTVRPPVLRYILVRNVFFQGVPLPIDRFLDRVPTRSEAALVLIGARERSAAVPNQLLHRLVTESSSSKVWEVWKAYAWLGRQEAEWIFRDHPDMVPVIAKPGLFNAPETFLPPLLTKAVGDLRPLNKYPDHPLRLIESWIESASPGGGEAFRRRQLLLDATENWLSDHSDWRIGGYALKLVLSPNFEYRSVDPGQGFYMKFASRPLLPYELSQVRGLWHRVLNLIGSIDITDWSIIHRTIEAWDYGRRVKSDLPAEIRQIMDAFAGQMLQDVVSLARQHPATLRWARRVAQRLGVDISIELDPDFEILYPSREHGQYSREVEERERAAVDALAVRWSREDPEEIAGRIARIQAEANSAGLNWPRWPPYLCNAIADQVSSRVVWVRHFINAKLSYYLILPFLRRGAETEEENWLSLALECLRLPELRSVAVELALTLPHVPDELLERALQHLENSDSHVTSLCSLGRIPEDRLHLLFRHPNAAIASAATKGEWEAEPQGTVRESLREDWEKAFVHSSSDYWLTEVFRATPDLAYRWIQNQLADERFHIFDPSYEEAIKSAVGVLTVDQRRYLIEQIPDLYDFSILVASLVGANSNLYQALLQNHRLRHYHSVPLSGVPEGDWFEKAILAYDTGYSPQYIAESSVQRRGGGMSCAGPWSAHWSKWLERFESVLSHLDPRIQEIGEAGRSWAIKERDDALRRERTKAVYGMGS
ncbi:MAG: hypothetical protein V1792_14170 [Pseudomonadota bacterium]